MSTTAGERRPVSRVRLTLAAELGHDIDGAWWLRTGRMARELPELVAALGGRLGEIVDIKVNWSSQGPPTLSSYGWESKHQPVMTICGANAQANLLVIPYRTSAALAVMVLRQAADLPVDVVHLDSEPYRVADCILRAARNQRVTHGDLTQ
jgi:hypothetical protein